MYVYVRGELTRFCIALTHFPCALDFTKLFKTETIRHLLKSANGNSPGYAHFSAFSGQCAN